MMKNCLVISLTSLTLLMACANNATNNVAKTALGDKSPDDRGFAVVLPLQADSPSIH